MAALQEPLGGAGGTPKLMRGPGEASQGQEFRMGGTYGAVTEQERRALQPHHQQLVGVPGHRVGSGRENSGIWGALWGKGEPQKRGGGGVGVCWGQGEGHTCGCQQGGDGVGGTGGRCPPTLPAGKGGSAPTGGPPDPPNRGPPELTSTCSHSPWRAQTSAMASSGSKAPRTVVPLVAHTKRGSEPCGAFGRGLEGVGGAGGMEGGRGQGGHRESKVARTGAQTKKGLHALGRAFGGALGGAGGESVGD